MANVTFRRGTEANLPSSGMADEGCFFLAEDTGNLYVGDENGNLVPINRSPYYGTCSTEASTNSKVVTIDVNSDVFSLSEGTMISVRFANANTAASPTLNVNGSGAIAVKSYGTTSIGDTEDSSWHAGEVVTFIYDGTYWMFIGGMGNIQPDWEQTDSTSDDYIKNRPSVRAGDGQNSVVEGLSESGAFGDSSHSEGRKRIAKGAQSHAEGVGTTRVVTITGRNKSYSIQGGDVKEGDVIYYKGILTVVVLLGKTDFTVSKTLGKLVNASALVYNDGALGAFSHVEGEGTIANNEAEHAEGKYNVSHLKTISSIGIGRDDGRRLNAVEVMDDGGIYIIDIGNYDGSDYKSGTTLQNVINGMSGNIHTYTIESVSPDTDYLTAYQLKEDGVAKGAKINIPKDMVVSKGEVQTVTVADEPYEGAQVGDKYIDLAIANATTDHLYIPVKDLVDMYYEGNGIDIDGSNVVSVVIDPNNANGLSVGASGVALVTATTSSAGAMSAADKTKLDDIASGAEVNVQSDWNQTDDEADDFIKNKPTIPPERLYIAGENVSIEDAVPYGYTKLEYVYNDSNTYQDTGIRPTVDDVELEIRFKNFSQSAYNCYLGVAESSTGNKNYGLITFSDSDVRLATKSSRISSGVAYNYNKVIYAKGTLKNGLGTIYVKNEETGDEGYNTGTYFALFPSHNIEIGRRQYNDTKSLIVVYEASVKINGITVLKYIPVKRNSDNVCGFWDTATNTFVTATAGQWNAGPVLENVEHYVISVPDIPVTDVTVGGTSVISNGVAVIPAIPDSTSDLTNDSGFITSADVPTKTSDLTNDGSDGTSTYVDASDLATVATSGSYNDLDDKPTIPSIAGLAQDSAVVHKTGDESIAGEKTFMSDVFIGLDTNLRLLTDDNEGVRIIQGESGSGENRELNFYGISDDGLVRLKHLAEPEENSDAATKYYVDHHGGGGGGGAGTLNTTNTSALAPSASESFGGTVNLHKVAKTGTYSDLIGTPKYALGESVGGPARQAVSLPYGFIDSTSTATVMTATVGGITELRDGVTCIIVNKVVGSAEGVTLNVNGLGAKPIYTFYDDTAQATTFFAVDKTCMFVYDSTLVTGGCWKLFYPFNSSTSTTSNAIRTYYTSLPSATACGRYRILFTSADGTKYVPANTSTSTSATSEKTPTTEKIDPFGKIVFYNYTTTRTAGQNFGTSYQYLQAQFALGYSFNTTGEALTLTTNAPVYIVCNPQTDGSAIIDATTPYTQSLPTTADGKIYIYLGIARSVTNVEMIPMHPVYEFKNGCIRLYTNSVTYQNFAGSDDTQSGTSGLVPAPSMSGSVKLLTSLRNNSWLPINSPYLDLCTKTYVDNMIGDIETLLAAI